MATRSMAPWIGALFACGLAACTRSPLEELSEMADEMCACKDLTCADDVQARYRAYTAANPVVHADKKSESAMAESISRLTRCRMGHMPLPTAGTGPNAKVYRGRAKAEGAGVESGSSRP